LDETEARAWQKLLSVMTHEIMNSVAPISSLAATLKKIVTGNENDRNDEKADLELGL
jgi:two-component system nitrogen regulation sensor histidine kinase NtrY